MEKRVSSSLDSHKLTYEKYKQTKKDKTNVHRDSRSPWVRTFDFITNLGLAGKRYYRRVIRREK